MSELEGWVEMITIRESNNNKDHIILDLGAETHGRSIVLTNQEAEMLAKNIFEKVRKPEYPCYPGSMDGLREAIQMQKNKEYNESFFD